MCRAVGRQTVRGLGFSGYSAGQPTSRLSVNQMASPPATVKPIIAHIKACLTSNKRPLFVAFQGPQGSGEIYHYITAEIRRLLTDRRIY